MKRFLQCATVLGLSALLPVNGEDAQIVDHSSNAGCKLTGDYSLEEPFDPKELRTLAAEPTSDGRRLMVLILRAGIEKDESFQDLLEKPELRKAGNVDLALSGYDYMLNGSEAALDHLLARLATEDIGADSDAIVVLQAVDEWDRTIRAFRKHFAHTDGAGGKCMAGFLTTRAYLFPRKYAEMREAIEAPISWAAPLLPRQQRNQKPIPD